MLAYGKTVTDSPDKKMTLRIYLLKEDPKLEITVYIIPRRIGISNFKLQEGAIRCTFTANR